MEESDTFSMKFEAEDYDSISEENNRHSLMEMEVVKEEKFENQNSKTHKSKTIHQCQICLRNFSHSYSLKYHLKIHTGIKDFACKVCHKKFMRKFELKVHKFVHENKSFTCNLCPKTYNNPFSLKSHLETHLSKTIPCEICKKFFTTSKVLRNHRKTHILQNFVCDICQKTFTTRQNIVNHIRRHMLVINYECPVCLNSFSTQREIKAHIFTHKKIFQCDICRQQLPTTDDLNLHLLSHADDMITPATIAVGKMYRVDQFSDKIITCPICSKEYSRLEYINLHLPEHFGFQFYDCKLCRRFFPYSSQLTIHLIVHKLQQLGEKNNLIFKCEYCLKGFSKKKQLQEHRQIHVKIENDQNECGICKARFKNSQTLQVHHQQHLGDNFFECDVCKLSFTSIGLHIHKRSNKSCQKIQADESNNCLKTTPKRKRDCVTTDSKFIEFIENKTEFVSVDDQQDKSSDKEELRVEPRIANEEYYSDFPEEDPLILSESEKLRAEETFFI